ncbi:MAG: RNA polymerase sigma factor [Myxococcota bacterium]
MSRSALVSALPSIRQGTGKRDVVSMHRAHASFVWSTLFRLGVAERDLPDMLQEVFLVVHRRLPSLAVDASERSWLFGIATRVTKNYRKRAHRRRERPMSDPPEVVAHGDPERRAIEIRRAAEARRILDRLDATQRVVFVMFEVEGFRCREIAEMLDVPVGTVHSRLHAARARVARALAHSQRREK